MTVDPAWLKDAVYPVYVDPTLTIADTSGSDDAFVNAGNNIVYGEYCRPDSPYYCELWLGQSPSPTTDVATVYMKWNTSALMGLGIDTASLQFFPYHQYSHATPKNTWVRRVTASWSESTHQAQQPAGLDGRPLQRPPRSRTPGATSTSVDIVRLWSSGLATNFGVRIDEDGNNYTYWKRLISVEQSGSYVHVPRLVYTSHTLSGDAGRHGALGLTAP